LESQALEVGHRVEVVPIVPGDRHIWRAVCPILPEEWSCQLVHRGLVPQSPNEPLMVWGLEFDPKRRLLQASDSNFGFLPISERMRPRSVASLPRVADVLRGISSAGGDANADKGMFSRCARRDQWDWRAVHIVLGEPTQSESRSLAIMLGEAAASEDGKEAARDSFQG
jgi:hypothetical protein